MCIICNNHQLLTIIAYEWNSLNDYKYIRYWVEDLPKEGILSFSHADVSRQFPDMSSASVNNALYRLVAAGKIRSVWRGFYAIVLPEYGISGDVPPVEFIDQLMNHLGVCYYVALLSAAAYQGSSSQAPQVFQVIANKQLRSKETNGTRLELSFKRDIPQGYMEQKLVKSGYVNVSKPAVTALDLVRYHARSGGLAHVASVLAELADSIDFTVLDADLLRSERCATVQRLGYILDSVLGENELACELYDRSTSAELDFSRVSLVTGQHKIQFDYDSKWKIAVNSSLEVDD